MVSDLERFNCSETQLLRCCDVENWSNISTNFRRNCDVFAGKKVVQIFLPIYDVEVKSNVGNDFRPIDAQYFYQFSTSHPPNFDVAATSDWRCYLYVTFRQLYRSDLVGTSKISPKCRQILFLWAKLLRPCFKVVKNFDHSSKSLRRRCGAQNWSKLLTNFKRHSDAESW